MQHSALQLLIGISAATSAIHALVRYVAVETKSLNREAMREISRSRVKDMLDRNQDKQDSYVNRYRHPPRAFQVNDQVFVIKYCQSTGKLDPDMRGPYRVTTTDMSLRCSVGPWVACWCIQLQDSNFDIEYQKGVMMGHADYLSRNPLTLEVNNIDRPLNWMQMAQSADSETFDLIQKMRDGHLDPNRYVC